LEGLLDLAMGGILGVRFLRSLGVSVLMLLLVSCATTQILPPVSLDFFVPAAPDDPWKRKVQDWQSRHDQDLRLAASGPQASSSQLAKDYAVFSRRLRRQLVEETVEWVQGRSRHYYRPDGDSDHWATLGEVIEAGEDDCDGLDLLTFVLLRRLGFKGEEIYRSIVVEEGSRQHHMVTLWFEDGAPEDPFVLDPTGVVTKEMVRLSAIEGWEPIQLFDESAHFRVEHSPIASSVSLR
jgi:hypothetical protein